jgi:hypothetical protein
MENRCWCLDATVAWGLSSIHTWGLWKYTIPLLVNPASSVSRMSATNCAFTSHFSSSHYENTTFARRSWGLRACTRWMWYGWSDCSQRNLPIRRTPKPQETDSGIFYCSSKYENFSKTRSYFSRHRFYTDVDGEVFAHLIEYCTHLKPVAIPEGSKACTVFACSEAGIVGSNPTQGMDVWCVCSFFCVCVVLCLGRGLATSWSPVQGVLPSVNDQGTEKSALCSKVGVSSQMGAKRKKKILTWSLQPLFQHSVWASFY